MGERRADLNYVYGAGVLDYALRRLPGMSNFHNATGIGIMEDGVLLGCMVYDNYLPHLSNISVSIVITDKRCVRKQSIKRMLHYPFVELGVNRITANIDEKNEKSIKLCKQLGFKIEGVIREGSLDCRNLLVFGMLRRECRWL